MGKFALFAAAAAAMIPFILGSAHAQDCVSQEAAKARMRAPNVTVDTLTAAEVKTLSEHFHASYKNPSEDLKIADSALVFHRPDANHLAWVILFQKGCAFAEGPIQERVYAGVAHPPRKADGPK